MKRSLLAVAVLGALSCSVVPDSPGAGEPAFSADTLAAAAAEGHLAWRAAVVAKKGEEGAASLPATYDELDEGSKQSLLAWVNALVENPAYIPTGMPDDMVSDLYAPFVRAVSDRLEASKPKPAAVAEQGAPPPPPNALDAVDTSGDVAGQPAAGTQVTNATAPNADVVDTAPVAGVDPTDEYAIAFADGKPKIALCGKYADRIPVQLKDRKHFEELKSRYGDALEVQS